MRSVEGAKLDLREYDEAEPSSGVGVFHIVQRFPIAEAGGLIPLLFVDVAGEMSLHVGAAIWARSRIFERDDRGLFSDLRTLGRLHDFQQIAWCGEPVLDADRDAFVGAYLNARYRGSREYPHLEQLRWDPVAYSSVRTEFRAIARYWQFQNDSHRWTNEGFGSAASLEGFKSRLSSASAYRRKDFFAHLTQSAARWAELFGDEDWTMPDLGVRETDGRGSTISLDRTMDLDEVRLLISREPNVAYKALFTLLAFGGVRISEALHMWQCDVLHPSLGTQMAGHPQDTLFLVVAHPAESRYVGDFTSRKETRLQHLAHRYGMKPRHHLRGYRRVGWKNPLETDDKLRLSQVFWADNGAAHDFAEYYAELRHFHTTHRTSDRHPWLFVNVAKQGVGDPIAYAKVREALTRGCHRIGLQPSVSGRRIHGLRHAYKQQLEALRLSRRHIQICMRHKSINSQEDYARTIREIRTHLSAKLSWNEVA